MRDRTPPSVFPDEDDSYVRDIGDERFLRSRWSPVWLVLAGSLCMNLAALAVFIYLLSLAAR